MTVTEVRPPAEPPQPGVHPPSPAGTSPATPPDGVGPAHHDVTGTLWRRVAFALIPIALIAGYLAGDRGATTPSASQNEVLAQLKSTLGTDATQPAAADRGFSLLENGVQHSHAFEKPLTDAERTLLAHQMNVARETALTYPTLADAEKAGMRRAGPFSPGLGTHLIMYGNYAKGAGKEPLTDDQIRHPLAWIYDGTKPDSPVAGLFYSAMTADPPGFAGPNDVWHQHTNICLTTSTDGGVDAPLGADRDVTKAQCDAVHGDLLKATGPLLHVWIVPGYEDNQGVYGHLNPAITCDDGSYRTVDIAKVGTRASACRDGSE